MTAWNARISKGQGLHVSADLDVLGDVIGKIKGISHTMESPNSVSTMVKYTWAVAGTQFNNELDTIALTNNKLNHVYEWGMKGQRVGRLWRQFLSGQGGQRVASFKFIASVKAIPKPSMEGWSEEAKAEYERYQLGSKRYVFHDKATIMEAGIPVTITSRSGGKIFIPLPHGSYGGFDVKNQGFIWSNRAVNINPGGGGESGNDPVTGNFTKAWETFWNTQGQVIFDEQIAPKLDVEIREIVLPSGTSFIPARVMGGERSFTLAIDAGAAKAEAELKGRIADRAALARAYEEVLSID